MDKGRERFEETAIIIRQEEIAEGIYSMWLHVDRIAEYARAGQFVSVYCNDGSRLLPRPISICEIDALAFLIGGGIGIPPMLELARQLSCEQQIILGFRDELFLLDEFREQGKVYLATEDGSAGTKGNVLDAIRENGLSADIIYACGPRPMLGAVKGYAAERGIECWISMEERMACGIGACLACVCRSRERDAHTNVKNKRVCKDGPVFRAEEVEL